MFRHIQRGLLMARIRVRRLRRRRIRQAQRIGQIEQRLLKIHEQIPSLMLHYTRAKNSFFKPAQDALLRAQREKRLLNPRETEQVKRAWNEMWKIEARFNAGRITLEKDEQWLAKQNWAFAHPKKTSILRKSWRALKFFNGNQGKILSELEELADGFTTYKAHETDSITKP